MNQVTLTYNPYLPELRITINGRKLSDYSALMEYRHVWFTEWCEIFFLEIMKEVNDAYSLTFVGGEFESEIMEKLAANDRNCVSFTYSEPVINMSVYERMAELERLDEERSDLELLSVALWDQNQTLVDAMFEILDEAEVFTFDSSEEMVCEDCSLVRIILGKVNDLTDLAGAFDVGIALAETYPNDDLMYQLKTLGRDCFVFVIGAATEFINKEDNVFLYTVDVDNITDCLMKVIAGKGICRILSEQAYGIQKRFEHRDSLISETEEKQLASLCQIEPFYKISVPSSMYKGRTQTIEILEIPFIGSAEYTFETSDKGIVSFSNMDMKAISEGKTLVSVYRVGNPEPIKVFLIEVCDQTLIQEIRIFPKTKYLAVGMQEALEVSFVPTNAVNIDEIKWLTSDDGVAKVDGGNIVGLGCGKCKITASTDETKTEVDVIVQPHISDIICPTSYIELPSGEQKEWKYKVEPEDCYEKDLIKVWCSDETIATYRSGYIIGKRPGTTNISICAPNNEMEKKCQVVVKKRKLF
ncbi:MAG: Ig-like domain-containing protein [Fermentimonas sp.]|jgi:hypothetical protein|nr:Ig-like domain-containing protein [Fermentimonas sp.]